MDDQLWDCTGCGQASSITRERQQCCIPTADGLITRTQHADGTWCQTFTPREVVAMA